MKPHSLDKLSSDKSVYSHLNKTGLSPLLGGTKQNDYFSHVHDVVRFRRRCGCRIGLGLALALSKVQQGIVGASYEHPMKKNRMTDNVTFFPSLEELLTT
jgi:hypothetical protein